MPEKNNKNRSEKFQIGKIVGLHALSGVMKVRAEINNPSLLLDVKTVTITTAKNEEIRCRVRSMQLGKGTILLAVEEFQDRTSAEPLVNGTVHTDRSQIADLEEDEFWTDDLVGLEVFTTGGAHIGTVCSIVYGAGELLEIRKVGGTIDDTALVPFVKALVPIVDLKARRIEIVDLPGLVD